ncbi:MAG: ArnT family glycosyltransferase [Rhodospirillales bacterium]
MLLACALLFTGLDRGGLSGYDDALYAQEAKEMLQSGDWTRVQLNGEINHEHPPMFVWLEAASMALFGVNDFAAKLPSALAGIGTILLLYYLVLELTGDSWLGLHSMLVLTTSQLFAKNAAHAMPDVPFAFFVTATILFYVKGLRNPRYFILMGLATAFGIMTRSILGVVPIATMVIHLAASRRISVLRSKRFIAGVLIGLALPALWFALRSSPVHFHFLTGKITAPSLHLFDYGWILIRYYLPWFPILLVGLVIHVRASISKRIEPVSFLPLIWLVTLIIPLSVTTPKYARYLLPAFPALALLTALGLQRMIPPRKMPAAYSISCVLLLCIIVGKVVFPAPERGADMRALAPIAERNTAPGERVLMYTFGEPGFDYRNQFLWYSARYTKFLPGVQHLNAALRARLPQVLIIDKASYQQLLQRRGAADVRLLGESPRFVCVRVCAARVPLS